MKANKVLKYNVSAYTKSTAVFGLIMLCLWGFSVVITLMVGSKGETGSTTINGVEQIYAGVCGLIFVKETFHIMVQNGVSRKSIWAGSIAFAAVYSVILTAVASLFRILDLAVSKLAHTQGIFMTNYIFERGTLHFSGFQHVVFWILFTLLTVWVFFVVGIFISALMYRLGNLGKTIFWVACGAVMFVGLPMAWVNIPMARELMGKIGVFLTTPANFLWFCLGLISLFSLASWPILRRVSMRTK